MKDMMFVVLMDRWVPQKYFDTHDEAEEYRDYCARNYQGTFQVQRVSADYPRRFERAMAAW